MIRDQRYKSEPHFACQLQEYAVFNHESAKNRESCNLPEAHEYIRALTYIGHLINKVGSILIAAYYYKSNIWIYYINF